MESMLRRNLKKDNTWGADENLNNTLQCFLDPNKELPLAKRKVAGLIKKDCQTLLKEWKIEFVAKDKVEDLKRIFLDYKWKLVRKDLLEKEKMLDVAAGLGV